jgi:2-isopropylmalate synthase
VENDMTDRLIIFDTTMRDGEQSPGASMTREEKLRIGKQLERMRVDVIEAGFPAASNGDFESVQAVAQSVKDSIVCGLARASDSDVRRAGEAVKPANASRIHTFIATSPVHMERKLRMGPEQVIEQAVKSVKLARSLCEDVEFSPEDAGRSEIDYLCKILEAVIDAGARTINIPDTVGYTMPEQFSSMIRQLRERIPNSDKAVWSVHCHNDLGLAVPRSWPARARSSALSTGWVSVPVTHPSKKLSWRCARGRISSTAIPVLTPHRSFPRQNLFRPLPAFRSSPTRRLLGRMRSPTSPAFTRMAC